jgi:hypothetical protein
VAVGLVLQVELGLPARLLAHTLNFSKMLEPWVRHAPSLEHFQVYTLLVVGFEHTAGLMSSPLTLGATKPAMRGLTLTTACRRIPWHRLELVEPGLLSGDKRHRKSDLVWNLLWWLPWPQDPKTNESDAKKKELVTGALAHTLLGLDSTLQNLAFVN